MCYNISSYYYRSKKHGGPLKILRWRNTVLIMMRSSGVTAARWRCRNTWLTVTSVCCTEDCWNTWARKITHQNLWESHAELAVNLLSTYRFSPEHRTNTHKFWWDNKADPKLRDKFIIKEEETERLLLACLCLGTWMCSKQHFCSTLVHCSTGK